jgi:hypothetical protein
MSGCLSATLWWADRGNTANDAHALRVVSQASLTLPRTPGPRRVCGWWTRLALRPRGGSTVVAA